MHAAECARLRQRETSMVRPTAWWIALALVVCAPFSAASSETQGALQGGDSDGAKAVDAAFIRIEKTRHQNFQLPVTDQTGPSTRRRDRATDPIAQRTVLLSRTSKTLGDRITSVLERTRDEEFAKREARNRIQKKMYAAGLMYSGTNKDTNKKQTS